MKCRTILTLAACIFLLLSSSLSALTDGLTQVSTIEALLNGQYDGVVTLARLMELGDFGIGTFNALDGELIMDQGRAYQIPYDGRAVEPDPDKTITPFAVVTFFDVDRSLNLGPGLDYAAVVSGLESINPTANIFYAIRITGRFSTVRTRSVPKQERPYPLLKNVIRHQSIFNLKDVTGTMTGFYAPPFAKGLNVPGYHLHFITEDRTAGGHVLDFVVRNALVEIDDISEFSVLLPRSGEFYRMSLGRDTESELKKVER